MTQHKSEKEMYSYYLAFMKNYYQVITLLTAQAMCITTIKNLSLTLSRSDQKASKISLSFGKNFFFVGLPLIGKALKN